MSNVRELFPGRAPPEPDPVTASSSDPDFRERFIEEYLTHTLYLFACLEEATDEQEFRYRMAEVQRDVAAWPDQ